MPLRQNPSTIAGGSFTSLPYSRMTNANLPKKSQSHKRSLVPEEKNYLSPEAIHGNGKFWTMRFSHCIRWRLLLPLPRIRTLLRVRTRAPESHSQGQVPSKFHS